MTVPARKPALRELRGELEVRREVDPRRRRKQIEALILMLDSDRAPGEAGKP